MTLFLLGAAWLTGLAVSADLRLVAWQWALLATIAAGSAGLHRHARPTFLLFCLLSSLCAGAGRWQSARAALRAQPLRALHNPSRPVQLIGLVAAPPEVRDRSTLLILNVELAAREGDNPAALHGRAAILAPAAEPWRYGDRVQAVGVLAEPSGEGRLSAESLAREFVPSWMARPSRVVRLQVHQGPWVLQTLFDLRARAEVALRRMYPDPEAALLEGILLGEESRIPLSMRRDFAATGTSHIVAISGFNLTILTGALLAVCGRWLGSRRGAAACALGIGAYTLFVGAAPPVSRAAVTALLALGARQLGRTTDGLASLAASAVTLTVGNPFLVDDLGFQLSFGATLGLIVYGGPWTERFTVWVRNTAPTIRTSLLTDWSGELVWSGLAAQLTTLPILVAGFHRFSWVSLLVNPIVLPVQPALMGLGGLSAILGAVWVPLGQPFAWLAWVPLTFTHHVVRLFSGVPSASIPVLVLPAAWGAGYTALLLAAAAPVLVKDITKRWRLPRLPILGVWLGLLVASALVWKSVQTLPAARLRVWVFDAGGEAVLIQSPTGRFVLIGGGASPVALAQGLGPRLPLINPRLDWVVLRSTAPRDVDGLLGLGQDLGVGSVLLAAPPGAGGYRAFVRDSLNQGRAVITIHARQSLDLGGGAVLDIIPVQEGGGTALLQFGSFQMAIAPANGTENLDPPLHRVSVALLPGGGDLSQNSEDQVQDLDPQLAVLAVEAGNREGLPPPELLTWLAGRTILRTDRDGWIEFQTDGASLSVWTERRRPP